MAVLPHALLCAFCKNPIMESDRRRGRPRDYCSQLCQGRAQRQRDRERRAGRVAAHVHHLVATDLATQAEELLALVYGDAPLASVLQLASQVEGNAVRLAAAAAVVAHAEGMDWEEIDSAAGTTEASARARWGGAKAARLLAGGSPTAGQRTWPVTRRTVSITDDLLLPAAPMVPAVPQHAHMLGNALKTLQQRSGLSPQCLARGAEMPLVAVHLMLQGRVVAPWALTYALTDLLGGEPEEVRWLWERAWHKTLRYELADRPGALSAVLRGAHLAAGAPELSGVDERAGLAPEEAAAVLAGRTEPDWDVFSRLFASLGGDPQDLQPSWMPRKGRARTSEAGGEGE